MRGLGYTDRLLSEKEVAETTRSALFSALPRVDRIAFPVDRLF